MVIVRTEEELLALMRPESVFHPFRKSQFRLALAPLEADENAAWQFRLERFQGRCGCTAGAAGLSIYILLCVAYMVAALSGHLPRRALNTGPAIWISCLFVVGLIGSALIGKLLGLSFAAIRFCQIARALQLRLNSTRLPRGSTEIL